MSGDDDREHDLLGPDPGPGVSPRVVRALSAGLVGVAAITFVSWSVLAVVHVDDRYHVGWVEGTRIALASSAASGVLYPPFYDGDTYGGTRFMPIPIVLHASLSRVTGEYLVSGKLLAYLSSALLLGLMFVLLRRARCPAAPALALIAGVLVTLPGLLAATTAQGEALPVVWQLGAVALVQHSTRRAATVGAAALCTVAILTKLSAVWAPLAIGAWLLLGDRRRLQVFVPSFLVLLTATVAAVQVASGGEMLTNLREVAFAGTGGPFGLLRSPLHLLGLAADSAPLLLVLAPFALVGGATVRGSGRISIWYVSLLSALAVLLVVMADRGALHNHIIDLVVLTVLVVGEVWHAVQPPISRSSLMGATLAAALLWGVATSFLLEMWPDVRQTVVAVARGTSSERNNPHPLAGEVGPTDTVLSEDPYVPVSLGRHPVVLDAWVFRRVATKHAPWVSDLAERIQAHEFDRIVLVYPLSFRGWYSEIHFGDTIADAIRSDYQLDGLRDGYYVYVPRARAGG